MKGLVSLIALALAGCSITTMEAKIDPKPQIEQSQIGAGRTVAVTVVDERPTQNLGKRSSIGGTIKMDQNLAVIYQDALMAGLRTKGFSPVGGEAKADSRLKVEIRGLNQVSTTGFWTMGSNIDAAVKAYADAGPSHYEQIYRAGAEHRTIAVSGAKALNAKINAVVNEQLQSLFADNMLTAVLAGKGPATQ